jgi:hypothetical protein
MSHRAPKDLGSAGKKLWKELVLSVNPEDLEMLANYCRQHSSLLAVRKEKTRLQKARQFSMMVPGRDGTLVVHPMLREETRLVGSLNRMLRQLGLVRSLDYGAKKKPLGDPRPKWAPPDAEEPKCGWDIESIMCGFRRWNERTHDYEDVPEGIPEHPAHPENANWRRGKYLATEKEMELRSFENFKGVM